MNKEQNIPPAVCIEEDEIDLKELFSTIWKYKKQIIFFVIIVNLIVLYKVITTPNSYTSSIILSPQGSKKTIGGGMASIAAMAGINLNSSDSNDPYVLMDSILKDKAFLRKIIKEYKLVDKIFVPKNLVYPFGLKLSIKEKIPQNEEEAIFLTIKKLNKIISLSQDKKSGLITLSATFYDRFLAKKLTDIYLRKLIDRIKNNDMKEIKKQIFYYKQELKNATDVSLKEQLSKSISILTQKVVFSNANEFYIVKKITDSEVAFIKDKTKPKRALILIVSFITSFIIAIFGVFFYEFIKKDD